MCFSLAVAPARSESRLRNLAFDHAYLFVAQRGSADGNYFVNACRVDTDHIHIAFDQHHALLFARVNLGAMQIVEDSFLVV